MPTKPHSGQRTGRGGARAPPEALGAAAAEEAAAAQGLVGARRPLSTPPPAAARPACLSGIRGACGDRRPFTPGERPQRRHGQRGGAVFPGPPGSEPARRPQLVRRLLQGALPHPARLLRAGLAAAHEFPVLLHRGLRHPQHPLTGTLLAPRRGRLVARAGMMADSLEARRRRSDAGSERPRGIARAPERACARAHPHTHTHHHHALPRPRPSPTLFVPSLREPVRD